MRNARFWMRNLSFLGKSDQAQSVAPGETTQVIITASSADGLAGERRDPGGSGDWRLWS